MPIIGIVASSRLGFSGDWALLGRATATTSTSSLSISGIAQTYKHLWIISSLRTDRGAINDAAKITFNGVGSGVNYRYARQEANGNGITYSDRGQTTTAWEGFMGEIPGGSGSTANSFGFTIYQLFNYSSSSITKSAFLRGGNNQNAAAGTSGAANLMNGSFAWNQTAAITDIVVTPYTGPNFVAGSIVSVYGAK